MSVQTPTVTVRKTTQKKNHITRSHTGTRQISLDNFSLQPGAVEKQTDEEPIARPQSQHLDNTSIIEILAPTSDKETPILTSASPKKKTRITRSIITSKLLTPSVVEPTITQTPPIAATITQDSPITATTDQAPTIITCASSQKRKHPFKGKPRRSIDQIG
jgi:hypothetical protein